MTGDRDGGVGGLGGDRADVGFIGDDPNDVFFLPASNTSAVLQLDSTSNVGIEGLWLFEVGSGVMMTRELNLSYFILLFSFFFYSLMKI